MNVASAQDRARSSATQLAAAEERKTAAIRRGIGTATRAAGPIAALGIASSGAADGIGLSNAAMLGLAGSMGGPAGAAIGATAGLFLDLASAGDDMEDAISRADTALGKMDTRGLQDARQELQALVDDHRASIAEVNSGGITDFLPGLGGLSDLDNAGDIFNQVTGKASETRSELDRVTGALSGQLGWWDQLRTSAFGGADAMGRVISNLENTDGMTLSVADAMRNLAGGTDDAATAASKLSDALSAFQDPALNAEEATDRWRESLAKLREELKAERRLQPVHRGGPRQPAADPRQRPGPQGADLAHGRGRCQRAGAGAGGAGGPARVHPLGHRCRVLPQGDHQAGQRAQAHPQLVQTVFKALGITKVDLQVADLQRKYKTLPKKVQSLVKAEGIPKTKAEVDGLVRKYKLTEKERKALVSLIDLASGKAKAVNRLLDILNGRKPTPTADLKTGKLTAAFNAAMGNLFTLGRQRPEATADANWDPLRSAVAAALGALSRVDGASASATITTTYRTIRETVNKILPGSAEGNLFPTVRAFSQGDVANAHQPQIAPAGAWRVWAEDETGGEAYVPLANDYRRPRAEAILGDVAQRFGMRLERYALGGERQPSVVRPHLVQQPRFTAGSAGASQAMGQMEVVGTLDTPFGPAQVRGIAREVSRGVVREEMAEQDRFDYAQAGGL